MDNFEKHLRENAAEFDEHKADRAKMWANIAAELKVEEPKVISLWKSPILKIVASVVLLIGIAGVIGLSVFESGADIETQYASKELLDIDMHYTSLVSYQVQLVKDHPKLSEEDKTEFLSFMDELDAEYEEMGDEVLRKCFSA